MGIILRSQVIEVSDASGLQAAVINPDNTGKTITFSTGTSSIILTEQIKFDVAINLIIDGEGKVTLDGKSVDRIFAIDEANANITLKGLTFKNGKPNGTDRETGGAIDNSATLKVIGCTFDENTSDKGGGAINNYKAKLTVINSTFRNNKTHEGASAISNTGDLTIIHSTFVGNECLVLASGAVANASNGTMTLLNSIFVGNTANSSPRDVYRFGSGGDIKMAYCVYGSTSSTLAVNRQNTSTATISSTFGNNNADNVFESGVFKIHNNSQAATKGLLAGISNDGKAVYRESGQWKDINENPVNESNVTPLLTDQLGNYRHLNKVSSGAFQSQNNRLIGWSGNEDILTTGNTYYSEFKQGIEANPGTLYLCPVVISAPEIVVKNDEILTLTVKGQPGTVLDANDANRIFTINSPNANITLDNLVLKNGNSTTSSPKTGGAIINTGTLTITHCSFINNKAEGGGAINNYKGTLTVINSTFVNNSTTTGASVIDNNNGAKLLAVNSTFAGNSATNNYGAAITNSGASNIHLINSILTGNTPFDVYKNGSSTGDLYMAYNIFGKTSSNLNLTGTTNMKHDLNDVFGDNISNILTPEGLLPILSGGPAATSGILVHKDDNGFYYKDGNDYKDAGGNVKGCTPTPIEKSQNGVSRTATSSCYNMGAYALPLKFGSSVVTASNDIINPFCTDVCLREAVAYVKANNGIVTFDAQVNEITLDQPLTIDCPVEQTADLTIKNNNIELSGTTLHLDNTKLTVDGDLAVTGTTTINFPSWRTGTTTVLSVTGDKSADASNFKATFGGNNPTGNQRVSFAWSGNELHLITFTSTPAPPTPKPDPVLHNVTIPSVEGATTYPAAGTYLVEKGTDMTLLVFLPDDYDQSEVHLLVEDQKVISEEEKNSLRAIAHTFIFTVEKDLEIQIEGVKKNNTVGTAESDVEGLKIYTIGGRHLVIEQETIYNRQDMVRIYTMTGVLVHKQNLSVGTHIIPLAKGAYIVTAGDMRKKIVL